MAVTMPMNTVKIHMIMSFGKVMGKRESTNADPTVPDRNPDPRVIKANPTDVSLSCSTWDIIGTEAPSDAWHEPYTMKAPKHAILTAI
jgi:hypothetical protein